MEQVGRQLLDQQNLKFAIVDAFANENLARGLGVDGFPTLKIVRDGIVMPYLAGLSKEDIYAEMAKQGEPAVKHLTTKVAALAFLNEAAGRDINVIAFLSELAQRTALSCP